MATDELLDLYPSSAASFLDPPNSLSKDCLSILSKLFESTVASRSSLCPLPPLSRLYSDLDSDGFGPDEVWAELELVNEPLIRHLQQQVAGLGRLRKIRLLQREQYEIEEPQQGDLHHDDTGASEEDEVEDSQDEDDQDHENDHDSQDGDQNHDDDRFFNIESMEEFVNNADNIDGGEGEYDLFRGDIDGGDEQLHYGDFFDPPPPSAHQKREERMKGHIARLEATNIATKSWQMSGETSARARPENSLLEEHLMFEAASRPAPEITEHDTRTLEDTIKQRIVDKAWDDVERRVKPPERPYNYTLSRPLDQEKSKLSLAEVYEQEYLKQQQSVGNEREEESTPQHCEIKQLMTRLFTKLDALTNYHFTPKLPEPEIKTVANVPSLSLEEVTPVSHSEVTMLAPHEIQAPTSETAGASERTSTDRKRERRNKKRRQHLRMLMQSKRGAQSIPTKQRDGSQKAVKSSGQFFSRLQQQVVSKLHHTAASCNVRHSRKHLKL